MIAIDGSYGEGGGAVVRVALALSTLLQKPIEVKNIRHGRPKPGLKAQHLHCIKALEKLCDAETEGVELGSEHIKYTPNKIKGGEINIEIGTAGSITLVLQSLLIPCFFADTPTALNLTGGTSGKWQMPIDFFKKVFVPHLKKYADIDVKLIKRGYYPRGGGKVSIKINPKPNNPEHPKINLIEHGEIKSISGISHASEDLKNANVAERTAGAAKKILEKLCPVDIQTEYCNTLSIGSGITLWAEFSNSRVGSDAIGEKGKKSEDIGKIAADNLIKEIESKAPIDTFLADNMIPFLGLFGGKIKVASISNHTKTNIYVVEQFLEKKFKIDEEARIITVD